MYFPSSSSTWVRKDPAAAGLDRSLLQQAVDYALANEIAWPYDFASRNISEDPPEYSGKLGPLKERGGPAGLVLKDGRIVAEWGDPVWLGDLSRRSKLTLRGCHPSSGSSLWFGAKVVAFWGVFAHEATSPAPTLWAPTALSRRERE